jgi:hypothetical protein
MGSWVKGQGQNRSQVAFKLWVNCIRLVRGPHHGALGVPLAQAEPQHPLPVACHLGVAVQVAFKSNILKPGFHLIGSRVESRRLSAVGSHGSGGVNVHRPTSAKYARSSSRP